MWIAFRVLSNFAYPKKCLDSGYTQNYVPTIEHITGDGEWEKITVGIMMED
jgi:hypothetical protein